MMLRIGITQRVEVVTAYQERRDCLDQRWGDLLGRVGMFCVPLANRPDAAHSYLDALNLDGLILSGGNNLGVLGKVAGVAEERDAFELEVLAWSKEHQVPLLGVCRGLQMLNHACGGSLVPVDAHVASRHTIKKEPGCQEWSTLNQVNSYHDYGIQNEGLAPDLMPLVFAEDGSVEACVHRTLSWYGIMWHPEREEFFHEEDLVFIRKLFGR